MEEMAEGRPVWSDMTATGFLGFRSNRSYPSRPDNAGGASDMFVNSG
jgi:hypothetical protein